jgi:DNA-binding transcriptional LysR family regulator
MPPSANTLVNRFVARAKFRHMQVLVKLSEVGSMRRASHAVNMTQPAISQLVQELEKLLETNLFFRHAKGIEPTDAMKELLPVAQRVLKALEDGAENLANRMQQQAGVVRASVSPAALGGVLHGRLDSFARLHPGIQVHFTQISDADPLAGIVEDSIDVVFTRKPPVLPEGWSFEACVADRLVVVCGRTHELAGNADITTEALGSSKWLLNRVGSVARERFEEIAIRHNWPQECRCQMIMHIPELTKEMLDTGKYLALLPRSVTRPWLGAGDVVELKSEVNIDLAPLGYLSKLDRTGSATETFLAHIRSGN